MIAGGALSADLPWQSVFWLAVVLNAIALAVVLFAMPETERGERGPLDTPGAVLLGGWLSLLIIAINQSGTWGRTSSATLGCLAAAAIVFVLWQQREVRFSSPLVPIGLVASRRLLPAMTVGICMGFASLTCYFGITGFAQVPSSVGFGFGLTLLGAGALLLPNGIGQTIVGFYAGRMVTAVGARNIMVVCMTLAAAVFAAWAVWHDSIWVFLVLQCVFVLTTMPTFAAGLTVAMTQAPDGKVAVVNGVYTVFTAVGAALAVAALTAFTSGDLIPGTPIPAESAWERVFIGGAVVCLIGALVALAIPKDVGRKAFDTASPQQ
jgi:MFS family permease